MEARLALLVLAAPLLILLLALAGCTTHCHGERCLTTTPVGWY